MGHKRWAPLEWAQIPDDADSLQPRPDIRLRHSHVNLDQSGPSSTRNTYLSAPASPSKAGPTNYYDDYNWNDEPAPLGTNTLEDSHLDPAYVHYLDVNEPGPPPPRRPRVVEVRTLQRC
jgi:hypothetical protein